ncbi:MAG: ribosomal L7Ae/L30e/S12e/Gadd45 family protein [Clostridia bacterium]|nr:ribosomal L7Ae/L30e/S12e/Gadd45 family protein [Clostridia bacterium]
MSELLPADNPKQFAETERRLLSTLGLCRRAGGLVFGTPMVCEAMRGGKGVLAVLEASDTSDNTHDKLLSKCAYYGVPHYRISATTEALGRAIGKTGAVAAVGITHEGFMVSLGKYLPDGTDA